MANTSRDIYLRTLTPSDLKYTQEIVSVINSAYVGDGGWTSVKHLATTDRVTTEDIVQRIKKCDGVTYTILCAFDKQMVNNNESDKASQKDIVVGLMQLEKKEGDEISNGIPYATAGLFSVDPRYQSKKVGYMLFIESLKIARKAGLSYSYAKVWETRPELLLWYKKLGYQETGLVLRGGLEPPACPETQNIGRIILRKKLLNNMSKL